MPRAAIVEPLSSYSPCDGFLQTYPVLSGGNKEKNTVLKTERKTAQFSAMSTAHAILSCYIVQHRRDPMSCGLRRTDGAHFASRSPKRHHLSSPGGAGRCNGINNNRWVRRGKLSATSKQQRTRRKKKYALRSRARRKGRKLCCRSKLSRRSHKNRASENRSQARTRR